MPWPANGGMRWAASPARKTRPVTPPLGVAGVEGVDGVALEPGVAGVHIPWREQFPRPRLFVQLVERLVRQAHELPPPATGSPDTAVVGRVGSQICRLIGSNTRGSSRITSTMSQS